MKHLNSQKGIAPIIAVILLAVTFVGVGVYMLGTKKSQSAVQKIVSQPSPTPTPEPTASWQTYMNINAGYSFKYPNDYQVMENQKKSVDGTIVNIPNTTTVLSSVLPSLNTNMQIGILYENQASNLSGDEVAKKFGLSTNATPYTIDGKSGFIFADTPFGPYGSTIIYIIKNNKSYTFTIESQISYVQYRQYLNQILSTFKFTPPAGDQTSSANQKQEVFDDGSMPTTWAIAGINDPVDFKNFFANFQQLVKKDQKAEIAKLIRYPIKDIKNEADFIKQYDQMFTQKVKTAVINQDVEQMFRNWQGVMVGNGKIWFHTIIGKTGYWIIAINN